MPVLKHLQTFRRIWMRRINFWLEFKNIPLKNICLFRSKEEKSMYWWEEELFTCSCWKLKPPLQCMVARYWRWCWWWWSPANSHSFVHLIQPKIIISYRRDHFLSVYLSVCQEDHHTIHHHYISPHLNRRRALRSKCQLVRTLLDCGWRIIIRFLLHRERTR